MITAREMDGIRAKIRMLDASVSKKVAEVLSKAQPLGQDAMREAVFAELRPVCEEAFELSAQLAQAVYNGWRIAALGLPIETVSASTFVLEKFDEMAYTALSEGSAAAAAKVIDDYAGYNIRQTVADTLFACAGKDQNKPRFARVPQGTETCRFCMMLASRGFEYKSGKEGAIAHNHANCDCIYVASWDKNPKAAGYDPKYYYSVYKHPEEHPEVADAINARRRELYAERKALSE